MQQSTSSRADGWEQFQAYCRAYGRETPAQLKQDLWVLWELGGKRDGWFIEFGAADGLELSNTYLLESEHGWKGVVAEPNPDYHALLKLHRHCTVSTKCVWTKGGDTVRFRCTAHGHLSRMVDVDPHDHHERDGNRSEYRDVDVETITLNDLLRQTGAPHDLDYLSIDTEGSELAILESLDWRRWRPRLITVEHNWTPMREGIEKLLAEQGYTPKFREHTQWDDWYVLTQPPPAPRRTFFDLLRGR
jgi:FkbM family methyltransferase